jgi:hypothetical protein
MAHRISYGALTISLWRNAGICWTTDLIPQEILAVKRRTCEILRQHRAGGAEDARLPYSNDLDEVLAGCLQDLRQEKRLARPVALIADTAQMRRTVLARLADIPRIAERRIGGHPALEVFAEQLEVCEMPVFAVLAAALLNSPSLNAVAGTCCDSGDAKEGMV